MHALRTTTVSPRSQAVILFTLTAFWWLSLFRDFWSTGSLFWCAVWVYCPFIMLVFAVILLVSYRRAGRPHRWIFRLAMLAAMSPLLFLLAVFVSQV